VDIDVLAYLGEVSFDLGPVPSRASLTPVSASVVQELGSCQMQLSMTSRTLACDVLTPSDAESLKKSLHGFIWNRQPMLRTRVTLEIKS